MNKIKELEDIVNSQTKQIAEIHKQLKSSTNKLIPGSAEYLKKNKNPSANDFINTTPISRKPK